MSKSIARQHRSSVQAAPEISSNRLLAAVVVILLLAACGSNIYLGHLFIEVHHSAKPVDSFCSINSAMDCVTVAESRYASFQGVPTAFFGAEHYGLSALLVLLSVFGLWPVRNWESIGFWSMLIALPFSILMAYLAAFKVGSLCVICSSVYTVNVLVLLLLLIARRHSLHSLATEGPRQLGQALTRVPVALVTVIIVVVGLSQLGWVPPLIGTASDNGANHTEDPLPGIVKSGVTVGTPGSPVKITEFSDYQCPACRHAHRVIIKLLEHFPNQIYFEHRDFPLDDTCNRTITRPFHAHSCDAAFHARCAAEQQLFWPYIGMLFDNQRQLSKSHLREYAQQVGIDLQRLATCLAQPRTRQAVLQDVEDGIRRKVRGTPTFFINDEEVGPQTLEWWKTKVANLIAASK